MLWIGGVDVRVECGYPTDQQKEFVTTVNIRTDIHAYSSRIETALNMLRFEAFCTKMGGREFGLARGHTTRVLGRDQG